MHQRGSGWIGGHADGPGRRRDFTLLRDLTSRRPRSSGKTRALCVIDGT